MKSSTRTGGALAALLTLGMGGLGASATPAATVAWSGLQRLAPREVEAGPLLGMAASRLTASSDYRALVRPTAAESEGHAAPSWGAILTARWSYGLSLTLAPRRETYGLKTREETVSFPDNPFPHTLKADTRLSYNVYPLLVGWGWQGARHGFRVQAGGYYAFREGESIRWIVDGEPYPNLPGHQVASTVSGWMVATEYGIRLGPGTLLAGLEAQRGAESLIKGLRGTLRSEAAQARLAYAWTLYRRP